MFKRSRLVMHSVCNKPRTDLILDNVSVFPFALPKEQLLLAEFSLFVTFARISLNSKYGFLQEAATLSPWSIC